MLEIIRLIADIIIIIGAIYYFVNKKKRNSPLAFLGYLWTSYLLWLNYNIKIKKSQGDYMEKKETRGGKRECAEMLGTTRANTIVKAVKELHEKLKK